VPWQPTVFSMTARSKAAFEGQGSVPGRTKEGPRVETFTAIASLLGVAAVLSFINDRYLRLQTDIGVLILAVLVTLVLRLVEYFIPSGAIGTLQRLTQSFNLNDTLLKGVLCFMLFRGSVNVRWASLREQRWLVLSLAFVGTGRVHGV
jgi:monovalent cation:H+ antiporter, CPA1 family